jgi:hypothetical protein
MQKKWFKNKTYGYGLTPSSWQGWLATVVYLLLLLIYFIRVDRSQDTDFAGMAAYLPVFTILTLAFLFLARFTGEPMEWRWGKRSKNA